MQEKVVDWLYNLQSRWGILKEEERSLYEYAYRLLLSRILIYSIIIALGIITGNWLEMFSFLLPFVFFKTVCRRNSLEKIYKLHLCFRFPDFYLWKIFSN